jgi:hypothetical protein
LGEQVVDPSQGLVSPIETVPRMQGRYIVSPPDEFRRLISLRPKRQRVLEARRRNRRSEIFENGRHRRHRFAILWL